MTALGSKAIDYRAMPERWRAKRADLAGKSVEFKATLGAGDGPEIEIKASGSRAQICGAYLGAVDSGGDVIAAGAFDKTLKERLPGGLIKLFEEHERGLGVIEKAWIDGPRLWVEGRIPDNEDGARFRERVKSGLYAHGSIGYRPIKAERDTVDGEPVRRLLEVGLWEVSAVIWPMQELAAGAAVKRARSAGEPEVKAEEFWQASLWDAGDLLQQLARIRWMLQNYQLDPADAELARLCIDELAGARGELSALLGIEPEPAAKGAGPTPLEPPATKRVQELLGDLRVAAATVDAQIKRFHA